MAVKTIVLQEELKMGFKILVKLTNSVGQKIVKPAEELDEFFYHVMRHPRTLKTRCVFQCGLAIYIRKYLNEKEEL